MINNDADDVINFAAKQMAETIRKDRDRSAAIQGLRDLADFLESHPDVPAPTYNTLNVGVNTKEELARIARLASWKKDFGGRFFSLQMEFAGSLILDIYASRETVCRRVVVGTEIVPATPEHEVEKVEWICDEALLTSSREETQ